MDKIRPDEVINFFEYEKVRDARRASVIELKRRRRVSVGRYLSLVFENRETVLFQIQEMCRAERIADDAKVREEIAVYNAFLPGPGELSATVRFRFSPEAARAFREAEVHLVMDHPAERARTRLSDETRARLLPDLAR